MHTNLIVRRARVRYFLVLLGIVSLTCPIMVNAQARGPQVWEIPEETEEEAEATHAEKLRDMNVWLGKLPGRYILTSAVNPERPGIVIDCISVGAGPGVQCMTGRGGNTERGEKANASMSLYGVDPLAPYVSRMSVNGRGIGEHANGAVKNDTLTFFWIDCWIPENQRSTTSMDILICKQRLKIRQWEGVAETHFILDTKMLVQTRKGSEWVDSSSVNIMRRVSQVGEASISQ